MLIVISGLPGCGKTRLSIALADALQARGRPAFVLHTDLAKVTLRALDSQMPSGSAYLGNLEAKLQRLRPLLLAHADKAERDGYDLIIEGSLVLGLGRGLRILLTVPESVRRHRVNLKHASATRDLQKRDLWSYRRALAADQPGVALELEATEPVDHLVQQVLQAAELS